MEKNEQIKKQILDLQKQIIKWNKEYFEDQNPSVDDLVYDKELKKLIDLENKYYFLFSLDELNNSPTKLVATSLNSQFKKVKHSKPMLSLDKAYDFSELEKWINKAQNILEKEAHCYVEPKIDGLSIALLYKNGKLIQALTRGDGVSGEDITENATKILDKFIPKQIDYSKELEVRGEVFLSKTGFEILKEQNPNITFANARNAASGILRRLSKTMSGKVKNQEDFLLLQCFIYTVVSPEKHNLKTVSESFSFLKKLGFYTNNISKKAKNITQAFGFIKELSKQRHELDYNIDGVVLKIDDFSIYEQLGQTSKFPHSAIAYKFEDQIVETELLDIFVTVGRTGKITYNAKLVPIQLNGTTVSAAILPNYPFIEKLKICINSKVKVKKAGEIIPQIIGSVDEHLVTNFAKVTTCPKCKNLLQESSTGIDQFCVNENCPAIVLKKLVHFCSKQAMNIATLAENRLNSLFETGLVKNSCDIFFLEQKMQEMHRIFAKHKIKLQAKSVTKFLNEITNAKKTDFYRLIFALGIKNVGLTASKSLTQYANSLTELRNLDFSKLIDHYDFGPVIIESLQNFFINPKNQDFLNCLETINFEFSTLTKKSEPAWASFSITGKLSKTRDEFIQIIEQAGAEFHSNPTKKTTYLLAGLEAGSKVEKAIKNNTIVLDEESFWELISQKKLAK